MRHAGHHGRADGHPDAREHGLDAALDLPAAVELDPARERVVLDDQALEFLAGGVAHALAEHKRQIDRQGGPVDRTEWGMTPQTVNAYYHPASYNFV